MKIGTEFNEESYTLFASGVPIQSVKKISIKNLNTLTGLPNSKNNDKNVLNFIKEKRRKDAVMKILIKV